MEDVFAFVGDQTNAGQWQAGIVEVRRLTEGPSGVGTRHSIVRTFMGRRLAVENKYVAFEPGRRIVFSTISGPMPLEASYLVESVVEGTNDIVRGHPPRVPGAPGGRRARGTRESAGRGGARRERGSRGCVGDR